MLATNVRQLPKRAQDQFPLLQRSAPPWNGFRGPSEMLANSYVIREGGNRDLVMGF